MLKFYILLALLASLLLSCGSYDEANNFLGKECGKDYYDPDAQFCQNSKIYDRCGGQIYNPSNQECKNNVLFSKCGNAYYNTITQFCQNSQIYNKCGGQSYDPLNQKCENNVLFLKCGNAYYSQATQFCQNSQIYEKCGGQSYDPLNQKCENNALFLKCGNAYYNQATQFCQNSQVYEKCGSYSYDPLNQKCENNTLFSKCGNEWYNPFSEYCSNNVVVNKGEFIDSRDNKIYKFVTIGTQTWMAENLQYETSNTKCYGDNPDNCKIFGILYDWNTALTICPLGWHLPSDTEWNTLGDSVGNSAAKLKANSIFWEFSKGTDDFGFTALPGGFYRGDAGGFKYYGECASFWSTTEGRISGSAHMRYLNNYSFGLDGLYINNSWVNVRCIKDI